MLLMLPSVQMAAQRIPERQTEEDMPWCLPMQGEEFLKLSILYRYLSKEGMLDVKYLLSKSLVNAKYLLKKSSVNARYLLK